MITKKMMRSDICDIIERFDDFLDNMFDRGSFDTSIPEDMEIDNFVRDMKKKYLNYKND